MQNPPDDVVSLDEKTSHVPFSISFPNEPLIFPYEDASTPAAVGLIMLGDFTEKFQASLFGWTKQDYENQWREAVQFLLRGGSKAALMSEYVPGADRLWWWPLYKAGEAVAVQNHILWFDQLEEPFSIEGQFHFVRDRRIVSENGHKISEWSVPLKSVHAFATASGWWPAD